MDFYRAPFCEPAGGGQYKPENLGRNHSPASYVVETLVIWTTFVKECIHTKTHINYL